MMWSYESIEQWHKLQRAYKEDSVSVTRDKEIGIQRNQVKQDMLQVLNSFLENAITLKEFNTTFQQKTHAEWSLFSLRGMSGGLFFNKLVKYIPYEDAFAHLLRMILRIPVDQQDGQQHMQAFIHFLEDIILSEQAKRWQLQPARVPFFLSVWWHIQEAENWPIFSFEMRNALLKEQEPSSSLQNPIDRYFAFKAWFLALKESLGLTSWELEQLILWRYMNSASGEESPSSLSSSCESSLASPQLPEIRNDQHPDVTSIYASTISRKGNMIYKKGQRDTNHTYIQWLLAKIGLKVGCSIWIAIDDHEKVWNEERLGNLSLQSLPIVADPAFHIQHIDVLWLRKNEIIAAYEIELTTADISKSLLRLSDLAVLFPKRDMQLCVVTPQRCFDAVQSELARPIFEDHDICKRSKVIIQEHLVQNAEHILRWANSPSVIHDLTLYLSTKEQ